MRIPAAAADLARYRAIERKQKEMVAECEKAEHHRCQVAAFDGGLRYVLVDSLELPDVRLVYAPPRAVGDYGGEVDNWSWPRHVGDFALLRVYAGPDGQPAPKGEANVPYRPRHFFPVAARGIEPGGFVMVAGYPGQTFRSYTEAEMRERAELFYPRRAELYRVWIDMMEAASKQDDTARIALADRIKGLANNEKNSRGQVDGIRRGRILERKTAAEKEILAWVAQRPEQQEAVAAHDELARRIAERRATWERDFLLTQMKSGPKPLELALTLARWAGEKAKPDLEREPEYQERNRERLGERLERDQKRLHPPTEAAMPTHVQGYAPRDGVRMTPQTTVGGVVEKNTGEEPFAAPPELLAAAPQARASRWADPKLRDVPVDFLADADTTGGNSGSPVVNGRGELVGVNFDRVWENVANDFGYNPDVARNISVDVRYMLWLMETLHGEAAGPLLREMVVGKKTGVEEKE